MKAIMMSIRPKYVADILNGIKMFEIRKRFPSDYIGWVYIYCTKQLPYLVYERHIDKYLVCKTLKVADEFGNVVSPTSNLHAVQNNGILANGKVVARFWCDKVEEIDDCFTMEHIGNEYPDTYELGAMEEEQLLKECCLTKEEMNAYYKGVKEPLKAIHITNLEIFDKPKELSEFKLHCNYPTNRRLSRAPQSWQFIEI